jgi:hypothetical protein
MTTDAYRLHTTIVNRSLTCVLLSYTAWSVSVSDTLGRTVCDESRRSLVSERIEERVHFVV